MRELLKKAEKYINENGSSLQKACIDYVTGREGKQKVINELSVYQNPDGGWANGLEIEYPGKVSSPFTTSAALGYISRFDLIESDLYTDTLKYLKNTQHKNGMWDDTEEMLEFPHAPYMGPGIYPEYKTGMILKWLLRLGASEKEMIEKAQKYLLGTFNEVSQKNDLWSAVAYSGAFSLLPHLPEYSAIMEWSMKVLMPEPMEFGWQQIMGMIEDEIPIPSQVFDVSINLIKQNQEQDGGWPHMFGTYNRVWSAIFIIRFLKNNDLAYQS
jgi:hypothetical protein